MGVTSIPKCDNGGYCNWMNKIVGKKVYSKFA